MSCRTHTKIIKIHTNAKKINDFEVLWKTSFHLQYKSGTLLIYVSWQAANDSIYCDAVSKATYSFTRFLFYLCLYSQFLSLTMFFFCTTFSALIYVSRKQKLKYLKQILLYLLSRQHTIGPISNSVFANDHNINESDGNICKTQLDFMLLLRLWSPLKHICDLWYWVTEIYSINIFKS